MPEKTSLVSEIQNTTNGEQPRTENKKIKIKKKSFSHETYILVNHFCVLQASQKSLNDSKRQLLSTLFDSSFRASFLSDLPLQAKATLSRHKARDENNLIKNTDF